MGMTIAEMQSGRLPLASGPRTGCSQGRLNSRRIVAVSLPPRTDSRWLADRVRACPYGAFRRLASDGRYSAYRRVVLAARCCRRSGATRGQCRPSRWLGAPLPEPARRALLRRLLVRRLSASISGVSWSPTFRQFCKRPTRSRAPLLSREAVAQTIGVVGEALVIGGGVALDRRPMVDLGPEGPSQALAVAIW